MEVERVEADYFDSCDECGEKIDIPSMLQVKVGIDILRLCNGCAKDLMNQLLKELL